jgi:hypothetical protein
MPDDSLDRLPSDGEAAPACRAPSVWLGRHPMA